MLVVVSRQLRLVGLGWWWPSVNGPSLERPYQGGAPPALHTSGSPPGLPSPGGDIAVVTEQEKKQLEVFRYFYINSVVPVCETAACS